MTALAPQPDAPAVLLGPADAHRCRRRVHLDNDPDADRSRQRPLDDGVRLRIDALAEHRRAVGERLAPVAAAPDSDQSMTLPFALHWQVRLTTEHRIGVADLLVLMPDGGYVPVLIRGHRTTNPGAGVRLTPLDELISWGSSYLGGTLGTAPPPVARATQQRATQQRAPESRTTQPPPTEPPTHIAARKARAHPVDTSALAHLYRMLGELGLASARPLAGVIGFGSDGAADDGAMVLWHDLGPALADYDAAFADRLAVATAAATRQPALALPSRIGECRRCPWWTVCGPELEAAHDVSLLTSGADVAVLREAGARTYDDVAAMDTEALAALPLTAIPAAEAQVRARAMMRGLPLVRRGAATDVVRAAVELDIDMESYGDDGAYLWGTYLTGADVPGFEQGYLPFVTWRPLEDAATGAMFAEFWTYLTALRAACAEQGLTFAAYCYSHRAEERWLYGTPERFPDAPGMPGVAAVAAFCGSGQWVDLYAEMRRLFIVPGSMRLKALAPLAGFSWRDPEPGGANSMAWYRAAVEGTGDHAELTPDAAANRTRILRYNEDDVIATLRLRQWITERGYTIPTADDLVAPTNP